MCSLNAIPLSCHVPQSHYFHHWEQREKFMHDESIHPHWILFAVEDGAFYYEIGEYKGTASFGDLVLCPPQKTFRRVVIRPVDLFVVFLKWKDDEGNKINPADTEHFPLGKMSIRDTARLRTTYDIMKHLETLTDRRSKLKINHYVYDLWLLYCNECGEIGERPSSTEKPLRHDPLAEKALRMIQQEAFQPIHLQEIATALNISLSQLSKKFKKSFGMPPMQYLTEQRLQKAKTLLVDTDLTLDEISECCGYQNGFYLNRVFKKQMHMTPMQFRIMHIV